MIVGYEYLLTMRVQRNKYATPEIILCLFAEP